MSRGDDFIAEQLQGQLDPGEKILHTAYFQTASGRGLGGALRTRAYWAALTPTRLLLIQTRVGAFKPLFENKGIEIIQRSAIEGVHVDKARMLIVLSDGSRFAFLADHRPKHASGQADVLRELAQSHSNEGLSATANKEFRTKKMLGIVVGGLAVAFFAYQYFYSGRAEVSVECSFDRAGAQCTASHVGGAASTRACWIMELRCNNGTSTRANACVDLDVGQKATISLGEERFPGIEKCEEIGEGKVTHLELEGS